MQRKVYFGTRQRMDWVPAPKINMDRSMANWQATSQRISGTANVRKGASPHRVYDVEWGVQNQDDLGFVDAVLRGDYGEWFNQGDDKPSTPAYKRGIYFLDPFAMQTNVLPDWWASPGRAMRGGRLLGQVAFEAINSTAPAAVREPIQGVRYHIPAGFGSIGTLPIPIPPGYTLHLGVRGEFFWNSRVRIAVDNNASTTLTLIANNTTTLTNYTAANTTGAVTWRTLEIAGDGSVTLYSAFAQIVPNGTPAPTGPWRPGEGSGVLEASDINRVGYSAALQYESLSARLTEVDY